MGKTSRDKTFAHHIRGVCKTSFNIADSPLSCCFTLGHLTVFNSLYVFLRPVNGLEIILHRRVTNISLLACMWTFRLQAGKWVNGERQRFKIKIYSFNRGFRSLLIDGGNSQDGVSDISWFIGKNRICQVWHLWDVVGCKYSDYSLHL